MRTDENASKQTSNVPETQTSKNETPKLEYSLVQHLPQPDSALRSYVEASEKIESDESSSDS